MMMKEGLQWRSSIWRRGSAERRRHENPRLCFRPPHCKSFVAARFPGKRTRVSEESSRRRRSSSERSRIRVWLIRRRSIGKRVSCTDAYPFYFSVLRKRKEIYCVRLFSFPGKIERERDEEEEWVSEWVSLSLWRDE